MATTTRRSGRQCNVLASCASLSHLPWPVNRDACQCVIIIMHCTSRLTCHGRCDNSTHC